MKKLNKLDLNFIWSQRLEIRSRAKIMEDAADSLFAESNRIMDLANQQRYKAKGVRDKVDKTPMPNYLRNSKASVIDRYGTNLWAQVSVLRDSSELQRNLAESLRDEAEHMWLQAINFVYGDVEVHKAHFNEAKGDFEYHIGGKEIFKP